MSFWQEVIHRITRRDREADLAREIQSGLDLELDEQIEAGVPAEEARYSARRAFGNVTLIQEVTREMWGWTSFEKLGQDLRYALRMLRQSPGFTLVAVVSLALGIGANTAIFSILNAVMLRDLPVREPQNLALFGKGEWVGIVDGLPNRSWQLFSYPLYREVQRKDSDFSGVTATLSLPNRVYAAVDGSAEKEPVNARLVSGTYFNVLGVNPIAGRVFTDAEDQAPGAHPVAVASYSWWKRRFAGDRSAVGRTLAIDSTVYTIIGVAPPEFFGTTVGESPDLWIPTSMIAQLPPHWGSWTNLNDRDFQAFYVLARLRPGISRVQAGVHLNVLFKQILHGYVGSKPSEKDLDSIQHALIELTPGGTGLSELRVEFSRPLEILMGAVGLVLLIACANVANLLLGRAASRHREIAVRLAIGAGRVRLVRQMLTESVLLSMIGGALGVAFACWASRLLLWMVSTGPEIAPIRVAPDARVLAFAFALSLATGILFGCAPALRATSFELGPSLKEGRGSVTTHARSALAKALIVGQVALSVVLLVGAVLFVRSLVNLRNVDTGFQTENVLQLQLDTANAGYKEDDPRLIELYAGIEQKVSEMPGVRSASFSMFTFNQGAWTSPAYPHGHQPPPEQDRDVHNNVVGPSFFTTMGLPVVLGRAFGPQDTAKSTKVAVISETMARNFFPNESPLGQRFGLGGPEHSGDLEVVGVVKDAKYERLGEHRKPAAYYPYTQHVQYLSDFEVRLLAGAGGLVPQIRQAIREVDPHLPIAEISTLSEQVDRSLANQKLVARLSSFFGLLALLLASIGIYGILSYAVARRTNEIGLRMALGARRSNVIWLVMRDALMLVVIGFAVGVPAAAASERLMSQMLFGLGPIDALSIAAGVTVLAVTAAMAAYLPARRASRVDPTVALRYE